MNKIYFYFFKKILQIYSVLLIFSVVAISIFLQISLPLKVINYSVIFLNFLVCIFGGQIFINRSPWLLSSPLKKSQLYQLCGLINVTISSLSFILASLILAYASFLYSRSFKPFIHVLHNIRNLFSITDTAILSETLDVIIFINFVFLVWNIALLAFLNLKKLSRFGIGQPKLDYKSRLKPLLFVFSLIILLVLFRRYLWFGFSLSVIFIVASSYVSLRHFAKAGALFGPTLDRWLKVGRLIAIVEITLLLGSTISSLHSNSISERVLAHTFLGGWVGGDKKSLVEFMKSDLRDYQINDLALEYRNKFNGGNLLVADGSDQEIFNILIRSSKLPIGLLNSIKQFDKNHFHKKQLEILFDKFERIYDFYDGTFYNNEIVLYTLPSVLPPEDVISLIESKNTMSSRYGLLKAQYFPDVTFIEPISKNILQYPDELKLSALLSLSIIFGKQISINDYLEMLRTGQFRSQSAPKPDCFLFRKKDLSSLQKSDEPSLNYCIRLAARGMDSSGPNWINSQGWLRAPLSKYAVDEVKMILD